MTELLKPVISNFAIEGEVTDKIEVGRSSDVLAKPTGIKKCMKNPKKRILQGLPEMQNVLVEAD
jgi:hypothetical protein